MNAVGMSWNGPTEVYEIDCVEEYGYDLANDGNNLCEMYVTLPGTNGHNGGARVMQRGGVTNRSTPLTASNGLRNEPDCPNPYLLQQGRSLVGFDNYHSSLNDNGTFPFATAVPVPQLAFEPEQTIPQPDWGLGDRDLECLFIDTYYEDILEHALQEATATEQ